MFIKKYGLRTLVFITILLLMIVAVYFMMANQLIDVYTFSVISVLATALIVLNIFERFHLMEKESIKLIKEGDELLKANQLNGATAKYEEALIYHEDSHNARMGLGHVFRHRQKYQDAAVQYKKAASNEPPSHIAHFYLGVCHEALGDLKSATVQMERAIAIKGSFLDPYLHLGDILSKQGDYGKAREHYEKFLKKEMDADKRKQVEEKIEKISNTQRIREE